MTATSEPRWHRHEEVVVRRSPTGLLLAPVRPDVLGRATEVLSLGGSGELVWDLLADAPTTRELLDTIGSRLAEAGPDSATIEHDVRTLLDQLQRVGLVTAG